MDLLKEIEDNITEIGVIYPRRFCYDELADLYTQLTKLKYLAIKCGSDKTNNHYTTCQWSVKNCRCGPDTCLCDHVNMTYNDLKRKLVFINQKLKVQ